MTAVSAPARSDARTPNPIVRLAMIEFGRSLRRSALWIGVVLFAVFVIDSDRRTDGFSADRYELIGFFSFAPLALCAFLIGVRTGGRDRGDTAPLAEAAQLDDDDRALARLSVAVAPIIVAVIGAVAIAMLSRWRGGYGIGDEPHRRDDALHSWPELLQGPVLVAAFTVGGVAAGRAFKRPFAPILIGGLAWFVFVMAYWAWQHAVLRTMVPFQTMPIDIDLPAGVGPASFPSDWLAAAPNEFNEVWSRQIVHVPTAIGHDIYLVGLVAVLSGLAVRGRRGKLMLGIGFAVAICAVLFQLAVAPSGVA